jgi:hypothetical protein
MPVGTAMMPYPVNMSADASKRPSGVTGAMSP